MRGLAAALAASAIVAIAAQGQGVIPDHFAFEDGRLIWIDASLSDPEPEPADEPCETLQWHVYDDSHDDGVIPSIDALREVLQTRKVISGRVTATAVGVRREMPYTVLQIDSDAGDRVYLLFSGGRLRISGKLVCAEDRTVPGMPAVGDSIVFLTSRPFDATHTLHLSFWVVYEHGGAVMRDTGIQLEAGQEPKSVREFTQRLRGWQRETSWRVQEERIPRSFAFNDGSGIHNGMPYSILAIAHDASGTVSTVYLLYPRAKFIFDGVTICNEDPAVGPLREMGDSILFMASYPIDRSGTLFSTPWVTHQGRRGIVKSPRLPIIICLSKSSQRVSGLRNRALSTVRSMPVLREIAIAAVVGRMRWLTHLRRR